MEKRGTNSEDTDRSEEARKGKMGISPSFSSHDGDEEVRYGRGVTTFERGGGCAEKLELYKFRAWLEDAARAELGDGG